MQQSEPIAEHRQMEELLISKEEIDELVRRWPQLDAKSKYLLEGKYILGKSDEVMAEELSIKPASVRMALTWARQCASFPICFPSTKTAPSSTRRNPQMHFLKSGRKVSGDSPPAVTLPLSHLKLGRKVSGDSPPAVRKDESNMALDGAYLHAVRQELLPLLDSRIEKIHQPTREELLVAFRGRTGGAKVLFSCAADRARVHLTQVTVENPKAPPMFCMLLRKRLGNGKLLAIRQDGLERVLYFDFSCVNELFASRTISSILPSLS